MGSGGVLGYDSGQRRDLDHHRGQHARWSTVSPDTVSRERLHAIGRSTEAEPLGSALKIPEGGSRAQPARRLLEIYPESRNSPLATTVSAMSSFR